MCPTHIPHAGVTHAGSGSFLCEYTTRTVSQITYNTSSSAQIITSLELSPFGLSSFMHTILSSYTTTEFHQYQFICLGDFLSNVIK